MVLGTIPPILKTKFELIRIQQQSKQITMGFKFRTISVFKEPSERDFNLPTTKDEWDQMLSMMNECGIEKLTAITMLKERKAKFDSAVKEYKKTQVIV